MICCTVVVVVRRRCRRYLFFSCFYFLICALRSHNERPFIFREFARFYRICLRFSFKVIISSCAVLETKPPMKIVSFHTHTHIELINLVFSVQWEIHSSPSTSTCHSKWSWEHIVATCSSNRLDWFIFLIRQ